MNKIAYGSFISEIVGNSSLSATDLAELQDRRLREIVSFAYENVEFYRKKYDSHGVTPDMIKSVSDLVKLPVISKEELRAEPVENIIPKNTRPEDFVVLRTSGSTGVPLAIYRDFSSISRIVDMNMWMYYKWWSGYPQGNALYILSMSETSLERVLLDLLPIDRERILDVNMSSIVHYEALLQFCPAYLSAYPSVLRNLGIEILRRKSSADHVSLIHSTAELLDEPTRSLVQKAFPNAAIVETYGSHEGGLMAFQTPHCGSGLHIFSDNVLLEPLEEVPGSGWTSSVTDLTNMGTPIIRYSGLGDLVEYEDQDCDCGLRFPKLKKINGRVIDSIHLPDGSGICPFAITLILKEIEGLYRFQLIQNRLSEVDVYIVPQKDDEQERNRLSTEVKKQLEHTVAKDLKLNFIFVNEITAKKPGSRKMPVVICNIDKEVLLGNEHQNGPSGKIIQDNGPDGGERKLYLAFAEESLRAAGQVFLCNNPFSGLMFLLAFYLFLPIKAWMLALICLLLSTALSCLLAPGPGIKNNGIAGINGFFIGLGLHYFSDLPFEHLVLYGIAGSVAVVLLLHVWYSLFRDFRNIQALCFPFILCGFLLVMMFYGTGVYNPHVLIGWWHYDHHADEKSSEYFYRATTANPELCFAWLGRGWSNFKLGLINSAALNFQAALSCKPEIASAMTGLGWCSYLRGDIPLADWYFDVSLTIDEREPDAWLGRGRIAMAQNRYQDALQLIRKGMRSWRTVIEGYNALGSCYAMMGNIASAAEMFRLGKLFSFQDRDIRINESISEPILWWYFRNIPLKDAIIRESGFLFSRFLIYPILVFLLIFIGILIHSRISFFAALSGLCYSLGMIYIFPDCRIFQNLVHLFNAMAVCVAFCGFLFLFSKRAVIMTLVILLFHSLTGLLLDKITFFQSFPPICVSFALIVFVTGIPLRLIFSFRKNSGIIPVPLERMDKSPEENLRFYRNQCESLEYWDKIRASEKKTAY